MIKALSFAALVALVNVASAWWFGKRGARPRGRGYWGWQGAGSIFRLLVIFGAAHLLWRLHHNAKEVVIFIFAAVILQLIGGILLMSWESGPQDEGGREGEG